MNREAACLRLSEALRLAQRDGNSQYIAIGLLIGARQAFEAGALGRAARLFGAADGVLPGLEFDVVELVDNAGFDEIMSKLKAALAPDAFDAAWTDGRAMTTNEAVALAIAENTDRI